MAQKKGGYGNVFSKKELSNHVEDYKEKKTGSFATYLDIKEGEEAVVRFLEKEPVKFWQHRVFDPESKNGRGGFRVFSCTRDADCPLCQVGNDPSFKVAWQIVHLDSIDDKGNVVPKVKLFVKGIKFAEYYEAKTVKNDPSKKSVTLERIGAGQNTQYLFSEWGEANKISYDKGEVVDLEEYFGLDDEKFKHMSRIAANTEAGPKKGKKSKLEDEEDRI